MSAPTEMNILLVDDLPDKSSFIDPSWKSSMKPDLGPTEPRHSQVLKHDFAVIFDVQMPEMDGFETAQLMRQRKRSAHTPIIFLTAFADEVRSTQGYATGGVDYISTPVVPEILRAKVRVFVELFRMRQQVAHQAEDHARREAAEEAARRSAFLADASRALSSSLDFEATLRTLARVPIPQLADTSLVALTEPQGTLTRSQISWADPVEGCALPLQEESCHLAGWLAGMVTRLLASSKTHYLTRLQTPAVPIEAASTIEVAGAAAVPPVESVLILPLAARACGHALIRRRSGFVRSIPRRTR